MASGHGLLSEYQKEYISHYPTSTFGYPQRSFGVRAGVPTKGFNPEVKDLCDAHKFTLPPFSGAPTSKRDYQAQHPIRQLASYKPRGVPRPPFMLCPGKMENMTQYKREFEPYDITKPTLVKPPTTVSTVYKPRKDLVTSYMDDFDLKKMKYRAICLTDPQASGDICRQTFQQSVEDLKEEETSDAWNNIKQLRYRSQNNRAYQPPSSYGQPVFPPKAKNSCPAIKCKKQDCKIHKNHPFNTL